MRSRNKQLSVVKMEISIPFKRIIHIFVSNKAVGDKKNLSVIINNLTLN